MRRATSEDLAFPSHPSREPDSVGPEDCLSRVCDIMRLKKESLQEGGMRNNRAQFRRAEKDDEGMALKIRLERGSFWSFFS